VKWLPKDALEKGVVGLPLNVNETQRNYKIAINETDPEPQQACQVPGAHPTSGVCRHFANCILRQVVERIEDYKKYQCTIGDYLAICCPIDVYATSTPSTSTKAAL